MLSRRGLRAALLFTALVPVVVGCSGPADDGTAHAPTTAATTAATAAATASAPAVVPIETATAVTVDRDATKAGARNEIGEPWRLDAAGAAACARAEFAFRSPETGGDLTAQLKQLRSAAQKTKSTRLRETVTALPAGAAASDVRSVLQVCTAMGYQL